MTQYKRRHSEKKKEVYKALVSATKHEEPKATYTLCLYDEYIIAFKNENSSRKYIL